MKDKKKCETQEEDSKLLNEPAAAYGGILTFSVEEKENELTNDLIIQAYQLSERSVEEGRVYTAQEVMDAIVEKFGWKSSKHVSN